VGDRAGEGHAYGDLGLVYRSLGNFREAIEYHKKALSIANEVGERAGEGIACYWLGHSFESLDSLQDALGHY